MISLDPLLDLLAPKPATFPHTWLREVKGAAEYAQIRPSALPLPAAWLVRAAERSTTEGERLDDVNIVFDVVIGIGNAREHRDRAETDNQMLAYRQEIYRRLRGLEFEYTPGKRTEPIRFGGGRILQLTDSDMYWADRYEFSVPVSNYLPNPPAFQGLYYKENLP